MLGKESARLFLPAILPTLLFQSFLGVSQKPQLTSKLANLVLNMFKQDFHFAALAGFLSYLSSAETSFTLLYNVK